jgi:hypothetical protein
MVETGSSTLVAHSPKFKCEVVTREQLATFPTPAATSTWRPVHHAELVNVLIDQLDRRGLRPVREQYAVGKGGLALFGAIDLVNGHGNANRGMALGLRHSNDKALAVQLVGGGRVFVCDNLSLSGEKIALHKHSRRLHVPAWIREGLDRFLKAYERFEASATPRHAISDGDAKISCSTSGTRASRLVAWTTPCRVLPRG